MRSLIITLLLLALVSPALGSTMQCTTRYDEPFKRWETECRDGSRAITIYDEGFKQY